MPSRIFGSLSMQMTFSPASASLVFAAATGCGLTLPPALLSSGTVTLKPVPFPGFDCRPTG